LAQNFAALRSVTTTEFKKGHMKMHINNILNQFETTDDERKVMIKKIYFENIPFPHAAVVTIY
jgi:hydroxymethylglutaryl-CoA reductase